MISSAVLQVIAIITMTIDHIGCYLMPDNIMLRVIGRISFPIFAFLLVEGFKHTRSLPRYFARLLITAIIAQFAIRGLYAGSSLNVLFSFCFALIALMCAEYGGFFIVMVPLLALMAGALECDYGAWGVVLVVGFYCVDKIFHEKLFTKAILNTIVLLLISILLTMEHMWPIQIIASLACIPIALYSNKKGRRLPRIFGYVFYPAHLFTILLIRLLFF